MKTARRLEAKSKKSSPGGGSGEDPDIAGIVPGPQRSPWADMGDFDPALEPEVTEEEEVKE